MDGTPGGYRREAYGRLWTGRLWKGRLWKDAMRAALGRLWKVGALVVAGGIPVLAEEADCVPGQRASAPAIGVPAHPKIPVIEAANSDTQRLAVGCHQRQPEHLPSIGVPSAPAASRPLAGVVRRAQQERPSVHGPWAGFPCETVKI